MIYTELKETKDLMLSADYKKGLKLNFTNST